MPLTALEWGVECRFPPSVSSASCAPPRAVLARFVKEHRRTTPGWGGPQHDPRARVERS